MNNEIKPQSKLAREYQETKIDSQVRFLRYRERPAVVAALSTFSSSISERRTLIK